MTPPPSRTRALSHAVAGTPHCTHAPHIEGAPVATGSQVGPSRSKRGIVITHRPVGLPAAAATGRAPARADSVSDPLVAVTARGAGAGEADVLSGCPVGARCNRISHRKEANIFLARVGSGLCVCVCVCVCVHINVQYTLYMYIHIHIHIYT